LWLAFAAQREELISLLEEAHYGEKVDLKNEFGVEALQRSLGEIRKWDADCSGVYVSLRSCAEYPGRYGAEIDPQLKCIAALG